MQVPQFYSFDTMLITEWFGMMDNQVLPEPESDDEQEATYVYNLLSEEQFELNDKVQEPGLYFMRTSPSIVEEISLNNLLNMRKFSFSELVFLSDIFSRAVEELIPDDDAIQEIAEKGEAASYLKELPSTEGLVKMREKVWIQYFDKGVMGFVRRIFSAIGNFFTKYNNFFDTGIYWPGNSCVYADKVVDQINRVKRIFIQQAYEASKEVLGDRLEVANDEFEEMDFEDIKKLYRKKALLTHPDKNRDPDAMEQFDKINSIWKDFVELERLKGEFKVDEFEKEDFDFFEEKLASPSKISEDPPSRIGHRFKTLPALPAPIAVI